MNFEKNNNFKMVIDCDNKEKTNYLRDFDYINPISNKEQVKDICFMNMVNINKPKDWNKSNFKTDYFTNYIKGY